MEDKIFMQGYETFVQAEASSESSAMDLDSTEEEQLINHATLGGVLKILKLDNLLSELDDDLELIATGKQSIDDHKEYFKTQIDPELRKISKDYHPDKIRNKGGSEEEISQATEMQKKINAVRMILSHFSEKFSECVSFKYSFFAQIEINVLSDEKRLKQLSYGVLTKLGNLASIKHEKLIPSLNKFLRSSQASMKGFSENDLGDFLHGKNNALYYFSKYLSAHKKLVNELTLLKKSFKKDDKLNSISSMIDKMLKKSMTQFEILNKLNESDLELALIKFKFFDDLHCINSRRDYELADKYFTLPFIEYINILCICNEIYLKEQARGQNNGSSASQSGRALLPYVYHSFTNFFKKGWAIYNTVPIDEEIAKKVEELQTDELYKISRYLVAYHCHGNKKGGQLAAELLSVDEISKEMAGALLVKIIGVYASLLTEEFKPGKSHEEQVIELLMEQQEIIKNGMSRVIEAHERARDEMCEAMMETNAILRQQNEYMETQMPKIDESIRKTEEATMAMKEMNAKLDAILGSVGGPQKAEDVHKPPSMSADEMIAKLDAILGSAGRPQKAEDVHKPSCSKVTEPDSKPLVPNTDMDGLRLSNYNQISK